jgi:tetratricopeptide (TPR) repeat protein
MNILNLLDKAIEMLDSSSKAINLFKQLMNLSHKITRAEHPSSEEDVKEYYRVHDELVKEPKEAIARAYQVNTKIPPTTDTNIVAHYYDDAMQYIQKLGYNIDLLRKKATKEEMGKEDGRCWEGYSPVAGVKPYEKGSCEKDMSEVREVITMLDKAINFYDPSQDRDASGKWSGSGGSGGSGASSSGGNLPAEKVSENINEKVSKFIEENNDDLQDGGDYEDNSNYHPIARLMRASEGWVGSNIPNKTTKESVTSGIKNISDAIGDALSMYGKDSSLGGALSSLLDSINSEKKNLK